MLPLHLSTTHNFRVLRVVRFDKSSAILVSTASTAFQRHHDKKGRCGGHHLQTKHSSTLSHHEAVTSLQVKLKCLERMHSHIYNIPFYTLILAGTRGTDYLWKYIYLNLKQFHALSQGREAFSGSSLRDESACTCGNQWFMVPWYKKKEQTQQAWPSWPCSQWNQQCLQNTQSSSGAHSGKANADRRDHLQYSACSCYRCFCSASQNHIALPGFAGVQTSKRLVWYLSATMVLNVITRKTLTCHKWDSKLCGWQTC